MVSKEMPTPTAKSRAMQNIGRAIAHVANTFEGGPVGLTFYDDQAETFGRVEIHLTQYSVYSAAPSGRSENVTVKIIVGT